MIVIAALILLFAGAKFSKRGEFFENNFSAKETRALKGVFAIYVVFHHLCTYLADFFPSFFAFKYLGFLMVGGFFLISGYGLMYGVINKENYLKGFFKKRILSVLIPYYIINLFYIYANCITGTASKKYIVLSLFGFNLWYVMAIVILYIGFFLSFRLFDVKKGAVSITVFTFLYIAVMLVLYKVYNISSLGFWWYNSCICFVVGIWYCRFKDKITGFIKNNYIYVLSASFLGLVGLYAYICLNYNADTLLLLTLEILCSVVFVLFVLTLTLKMQIGNPVLNICGDLSLELYLSHAIFISAFKGGITAFGKSIIIDNNFLYMIAILVASFIFSYVIHYISAYILKLINKKGNR